MPDVIKLLPDSVANQIAAGEVVQRPASAVKELLENAVDAGSTHITLIVKNAGKTLIQVTDNGSGMSETDARLCFERHATSKIKDANDLFAINTLGFRGEALASIAAVAQLEMKSRPRNTDLGTRILIEGSELKAHEPCQCPQGTSIAVKNLFYNIPARRNFLKSNTVELRHIVEEFQRVALANTRIHFEMHHNGVEMFHLPVAKLRKRITDVFGRNVNERLVPVEETADFLRIYGFVGKPEYARKTRGEQYFFINERFIKSPYLNHAVLAAYDRLLPEKAHPLYVLFIDIDPARIDVNVHPTKQEIKFDDEKTVYAILNAATKHALGVYSVMPAIDFSQNIGLGLGAPTGNPKHSPGTKGGGNLPVSGNGANREERERFKRNAPPADWQKLFQTESAAPANHGRGVQQEPELGKSGDGADGGTLIFKSDWEGGENQAGAAEKCPYQIHGRYIVAHIKSGIILLDQRAAHERILYEKYLAAGKHSKPATQKQLFPQTVELNRADAILMKELLPHINEMGYDIEGFGQNGFIVHGIPSDLAGGGGEGKNIEKLLESHKLNRSNTHDQRTALARSMARFAAVKYGQRLGEAEMQSLVDKLFACETPFVAPGGKPTFVRLSLDDIAKLFENG